MPAWTRKIFPNLIEWLGGNHGSIQPGGQRPVRRHQRSARLLSLQGELAAGMGSTRVPLATDGNGSSQQQKKALVQW